MAASDFKDNTVKYPARSETNVDPFSLYLQEISTVALLSVEKEVVLTQKVYEARIALASYNKKYGALAMPLKALRPKSRKDEEFIESIERLAQGIALSIAVMVKKNGDARSKLTSICHDLDLTIQKLRRLQSDLEVHRADYHAVRDQMTSANLRLVIAIARHYRNRGLNMHDLVQEGNIGLLKAVDRFDPRFNNKFSTYAYWWIKQAIDRALAESPRAIRVPVHVHEKIRKIRAIAKRLYSYLGRQPSPEEISLQCEFSAGQVAIYLDASCDILSLDYPLSDERDADDIKKIIPDPKAPSPLVDAMISERKEAINSVLRTLDPKEAAILKMRYGIGYDREYTLREVGLCFDVTRERIRQIQLIALKKVKHPFVKVRLRAFMDEPA